MKKILFVQLTAFAIILTLSARPAFADDATPPAVSHEEHHPEGDAAKDKTDGGMMGGMDMAGMSGMMHECMGMHKDGKMCSNMTMEKCQEKMGKGDCQKMMKQMKAQKKSKAKKKAEK